MGALSTRLGSRGITRSKLRNAPHKSGIAASIQLATLVDATSSMRPYIEVVGARTKHLLEGLAARFSSIQLSCGFYRDHDCTRPFDFFGEPRGALGQFVGVSRISELEQFLDDAGSCEGNSTSVEALGAAFRHVSELPWSARHRIVVQVGDHASHGFTRDFVPEFEGDHDSVELCPLGMTHERILRCLEKAKLRCYMVRCGDNVEAERQYRDIATATSGRFIDFKDVEAADGLMVAIEAAVVEGAGGDARKFIENKQQAGQIESSTVRALLDSFGDGE